MRSSKSQTLILNIIFHKNESDLLGEMADSSDDQGKCRETWNALHWNVRKFSQNDR